MSSNITETTSHIATDSQQTVRMYSTTWCPDCHRAKAFLKSHGIGIEEIDIEQDPKAAELVMSHNDGKRRVPTLEIGGKYYGNPSFAELAELIEA